MSTDNRTTLNDCSASFTGGDDTGSTTTLNGLVYEGSQALAVQFTNSDERTYTTNIGGTRDLSDATCYLLVKDNLIESQANGGVKYILYDGSDEIGYEVGGYDNIGLPLATFFNSYKLDVSNSGAFTAHAFSGSEGNLNKASITGVGFGTLHLAKAQGSIDNCFVDRLSFVVNGNPALTINGGSSGTPITLADTSADDISNGWGLVSNPQGEQYNIFGPTEWGDSGTASTYFDESGSQITLIGTGVGTGNFDMSLVGNSTGTNLFKLNNSVVVGLGAVANWDFSDVNFDTMEVDTTQFVDAGTITLPVTGGTSRKFNDNTMVNCGQVDPSTVEFLRNTFVGTTDANGALLGNKSLDSMAFTSDGTGHAIYITTPGSYTYTLNSFTGYGATTSTDAVIYNNSGGAVTINVNSGDTPTYRNGTSATTSIVAGAVSATVHVVNSSGTDIQNARVFLPVSDGTGPFPYQESVTITSSGTVATCTHTGHGLETNDKVSIRGAAQHEYNGVRTITVTDANTYTFTIVSTTSPATGTITSTFIVLEGLTDVNGEITMSRTFASNQPIAGHARKSSASPFYKTAGISGSVDSGAGFNATIQLISDE